MGNKNTPVVSVIMPVYNAEKYLEKSIESILNQTFTNFEFIILNDGSSDSSSKIVDIYARKDKRIMVAGSKIQNKGYAYRLNEGVDLATGKYIARMDADDIAVKTRFQEQVVYLDTHHMCSVLFTEISQIDELGKDLGSWPVDTEVHSHLEILGKMPLENCVAHPTLMIRSEVLKRFQYDVRQVPSEDYDLWLRLLSNGYCFHKLNEKLLQYRIHAQSVSQMSISASSPHAKYIRVKSLFLRNQVRSRKFGGLELRILFGLVGLKLSILTNRISQRMRMLTNTFLSFFKKSRLKTVYAFRKAGSPNTRILFVIPWMTIGGADKVFLDLMAGLNKLGYTLFCISTESSKNEWIGRFRKLCNEVVVANQKFSRNQIPQFIVDYSIKNKVDVVITSNNASGYLAGAGLKMANPRIKIIDIIHGQGGKFEKGGWPFHSAAFDGLLDKRVVVTNYMKKYLIDNFGVSPQKIVVIHNGINEDSGKQSKTPPDIRRLDRKFIVLWSGRFNEEKHPELAIETAKKVLEKSQNIHFILAGTGEMGTELVAMVKRYGIEKGVTITKRPYKNYRAYMGSSDLLLVTSEMEGLPIVILEAFSMGLPVIAPAVGGIPEVVQTDKNGYLLKFSNTLPSKAAEKILYLNSHPAQCKKMGHNGYLTVRTNFSMESMIDHYRKVVEI